MAKVVITAALNGLTTHRSECPAVPFTPAEIGAEAQRAEEAGAAIVHVHARESGGAPSYRAEQYYEVLEAIRSRTSLLVGVSTGAFGVSLAERMTPLDSRPDFATVPLGTMSYARFNPGQKSFDYDHVFANPFGDVVAVVERMRERGICPIASCYDLGHISSIEPLSQMGVISDGVLFNLTLGVTGGIGATPHNLAQMFQALPPAATWHLTATGTDAWRMRAAALSMGGHLRVGFEDGARLPGGDIAESNGTLVSAAVRLVEAVGCEVASVADAKALFLGDNGL